MTDAEQEQDLTPSTQVKEESTRHNIYDHTSARRDTDGIPDLPPKTCRTPTLGRACRKAIQWG